MKRNFISLLASEATGRIITFIVTIYLAHSLGVEGFGKVNFAFAIVFYFMLLLNMGFDAVGTRAIATDAAESTAIMLNIVAARAVLALGAFVLLYITTALVGTLNQIKSVVLIYGLDMFVYTLLIEWFFQGLERMHVVAISRILRQCVYALLIVLFVKSPANMADVPIARVVSGAAVVLFFGAVLLKNGIRPRFTFNRQFLITLFKQSLPVSFAGIAAEVYHYTDRLMLGFIKDMSVVGNYVAAHKVVAAAPFLTAIISYVFFPKLCRVPKERTSESSRLVDKYLSLMLMSFIPLGLGGMLLAPEIISFLYGSEYASAVTAMRILSWNIVTSQLAFTYGYPLVAWQKQTTHLKIVSSGAAANVVLNFLLIPSFGMVGAASATIVAELFVFFLFYRVFNSIHPHRFFSLLFKPVIAALAMAVVIICFKRFFSEMHVLFMIAAGAASYAVSIFLLGSPWGPAALSLQQQ